MQRCRLSSKNKSFENPSKSKYLWLVFTRDRRRKKESNTRIGKQTHFCVSFIAHVHKRVVLKHCKDIVFQIGLCSNPHLWSWFNLGVMTEIDLSPAPAAEMEFSRRVHRVPLRDEVGGCRIRKTLNVEPLLRIERSQLRCFGHISRISQQSLPRHVLLATPARRQPRGRSRTSYREYISNLA